ncbi:ATP-binding protein [Phenylobacterium sp. LjRoot225]|uniref:sensor histidine kinase n=1 Tax=Phenylobacterium sp. LjRoot225 TaxID=3342285 RepID=UPI003ED05DCE
MPCEVTVAGLDGDPRSAPEGFPGAAGVVHDLGNLIQIAASAVNVVSRSPRAAQDPGLEPILARARTALERAGALVHQTRRRTVEPSFEVRAAPDLQSIPACLDEIRALLAWICEPGVTLAIELGPDLPLVRCNRLELQNAVLNFVINARDATPDGGSIGIVARRVAEGAFAGVMELSVVDDGAGMSRETLAQAFNPYFTTKADGRGTGLGLAIVRRFAHEAGGRVDIVSAPGEGTTVTLRLPPAGLPGAEA